MYSCPFDKTKYNQETTNEDSSKYFRDGLLRLVGLVLGGDVHGEGRGCVVFGVWELFMTGE